MGGRWAPHLLYRHLSRPCTTSSSHKRLKNTRCTQSYFSLVLIRACFCCRCTPSTPAAPGGWLHVPFCSALLGSALPRVRHATLQLHSSETVTEGRSIVFIRAQCVVIYRFTTWLIILTVFFLLTFAKIMTLPFHPVFQKLRHFLTRS